MTEHTPDELSPAMQADYHAILATNPEVAAFMLGNGCCSEDAIQTMAYIDQQDDEAPWDPSEGFTTF